MAAGSSAPELATSLIGVLIAKDDIGVGTVVGSAVFNIAFVISVCALFAGRVIRINWWPILRDSLFYLISICLLFIVMFDKKVSLIESMAFLIVYVFYIIFMAYNKQIENKLSPKLSNIFGLTSTRASNYVSYDVISDTNSCEQINSSSSSDVESIVINEQTNEESTQMKENYINMKHAQLFWDYMVFPFNFVHRLTLRECKIEDQTNWFGITFVVSCIWISLYSYLIVWMITIIGKQLKTKDFIRFLSQKSFLKPRLQFTHSGHSYGSNIPRGRRQYSRRHLKSHSCSAGVRRHGSDQCYCQ